MDYETNSYCQKEVDHDGNTGSVENVGWVGHAAVS